MTDPLSISAAAVGFVSLALQVAQTTTQFVQDAKGFPEEFKKLSLAINEFGVLVRRLTPAIEKVEARHETEGISDFYFPLTVHSELKVGRGRPEYVKTLQRRITRH
jgi:hypothetical protein